MDNTLSTSHNKTLSQCCPSSGLNQTCWQSEDDGKLNSTRATSWKFVCFTLYFTRRQESPFIQTATRLVQSSLSLVKDANEELQKLLQFPLTSTLATEEVSEVLEDNFKEVKLTDFHLLFLLSLLQVADADWALELHFRR